MRRGAGIAFRLGRLGRLGHIVGFGLVDMRVVLVLLVAVLGIEIAFVPRMAIIGDCIIGIVDTARNGIMQVFEHRGSNANAAPDLLVLVCVHVHVEA